MPLLYRYSSYLSCETENIYVHGTNKEKLLRDDF